MTVDKNPIYIHHYILIADKKKILLEQFEHMNIRTHAHAVDTYTKKNTHTHKSRTETIALSLPIDNSSIGIRMKSLNRLIFFSIIR